MVDRKEIAEKLQGTEWELIPLDEVRAQVGKWPPPGWRCIVKSDLVGGWALGEDAARTHSDMKSRCRVYDSNVNGRFEAWVRPRKVALEQRADFLGYEVVPREDVAKAANDKRPTGGKLGWTYINARQVESGEWDPFDGSDSTKVFVPDVGYGVNRGFIRRKVGHTEKTVSTKEQEDGKVADFMPDTIKEGDTTWVMIPADVLAARKVHDGWKFENENRRFVVRTNNGQFIGVEEHDWNPVNPLPAPHDEDYGERVAVYVRVGTGGLSSKEIQDAKSALVGAMQEGIEEVTEEKKGEEKKEETALTIVERGGELVKAGFIQGVGAAAGSFAVDTLQWAIENALGVGQKNWFGFQKGKLARFYLRFKAARGGNRAIRGALAAVVAIGSLVATKQAKGEEVAPILALLPKFLARMGIAVGTGAVASEVAETIKDAVRGAAPLLKKWLDNPIGQEVVEAVVESMPEEERPGLRQVVQQVATGRTM